MIRRLFLFLWLCLSMAGSAVASDRWSLKDIEGAQHRLSDYRGKWVLVNFWATWCPTCLAEVPDFSSLTRLQKDNDLVIIGIAVSYKKPAEVLDFVRKKSIPYPIVLGDEDIAAEFGGFSGLPTSFLYSPSGKLVGHHEGPLTKKDIELATHGNRENTIFTPH